jgi:hypothetical protein
MMKKDHYQWKYNIIQISKKKDNTIFYIFIMEDIRIQILKKVGLAAVAGISGIITYNIVSEYLKKRRV